MSERPASPPDPPPLRHGRRKPIRPLALIGAAAIVVLALMRTVGCLGG